MPNLNDWLKLRLPFLRRGRANPSAQLILDPWRSSAGAADDWAPSHYASYFATSVPVYAAIRLRADAVARAPLKIYSQVVQTGKARRQWVGPQHPAQKLLDRVNPHWTGGDLWRATETYLSPNPPIHTGGRREDSGRV